MLKITDDLMKRCLDGFETEYECPVFGTLAVIDSFWSTGRSYLPAFAAVSKYRTLLVAAIPMSIYADGSTELTEYPMLRFEYCRAARTLFGGYMIRAKYNGGKKIEIIKFNIMRKVFGAELSAQETNIDKFAELCGKWGNSGLFG